MNDLDRKKLRNCAKFFIENVKQYPKLCDLLFEKLNFSNHLKDKILKIEDDNEQKRELLSCAAKRGPHAFGGLLKCLLETDNSHVVNTLEKDVLSVENNRVRKGLYWMDYNLTDSYKMRSRPRGKALIVNVYNFNSPEQEERKGSDVDVKNLKTLWKGLGYDVATHTDPTARELKDLVKRFSCDLGKTDVDSCVLIIMSHGSSKKGKQGVNICCTDNVEVYSQELVEKFSVEMCPAMAGKPKLFFFQACRGKDPQLAVIHKGEDMQRIRTLCLSSPSLHYDTSPKLSTDGELSNDGTCNSSSGNRTAGQSYLDNGDILQVTSTNRQHESVNGDSIHVLLDTNFNCSTNQEEIDNFTTDSVVNSRAAGNGLPLTDANSYQIDVDQYENISSQGIATDNGGLSDVLIIYSSNPGFLAARDEVKGSWLMQEIVKVFSEEAYSKELIEMISLVQRNLSKKIGPVLQLVNYENFNFKKKLYFNPGL